MASRNPSSSASFLSREDSSHSSASMPRGTGAALGPPPSNIEDPTSKSLRISLQLEARNLPNMDSRGKSDPFVILYRKLESRDSTNEVWETLDQTETVYNNLNPKWSTCFAIDYRFGTNTVLKFDIYDRDSIDNDLSKQDYIGEVTCTVAQIVLADNQRLSKKVRNLSSGRPSQNLGTLVIRGEEQKGDLGDNVTFLFAVTELRRGRKPFYILSRKNRHDSEFSPVVYSEVHQAYAGTHQVTTFKPSSKSLARLVNGDLDRPLKVEIFDYDRRGSHYRGGSVIFTLRSARSSIANSGRVKYSLRKVKSNGQVVNAGILIMKKCEISVPYTFLDYLGSGVVINTVIAVDMSSSNGNPAFPSSLHYNNRSSPNEYVIALREVGSVLASYDTSKTFPAFGFGAALPPKYQEAAQCFSLTGNIMQPVCNGIDGVIDMYYNALDNVAPHAPCRYGPVLEHVIRIARQENESKEQTVYTILLIVTDGEFCDFADVANLICSATELPLSIVIVGVGNTRFLQLERLDGDVNPLCSTDGTPCSRDIVQFVEFHTHRHNTTRLSQEVLDEIPDQLVSYMRSNGIKPSDLVPLEGAPSVSRDDSPRGPYLPHAGVGHRVGVPTAAGKAFF